MRFTTVLIVPSLAMLLVIDQVSAETGTVEPVMAEPIITQPAPVYYDPMPGPYYVFPGADGAIDKDQEKTLQNAFEGWRETDQQRFLLCYFTRSTAQEPLEIRQKSLSVVSETLKGYGAQATLTSATPLCEALRPAIAPAAADRYIIVWGVNSL